MWNGIPAGSRRAEFASPYVNVDYSDVYCVKPNGDVSFSYVTWGSCGHFALRGPMTSTVHTVCTIMATSTTTVWIGIPTGSPLNGNEKVACYVTTLGVVNGYYGVFWDSGG